MDDAIWIAEKASGKAKLEWKEASVIMVELGFKTALLSLRAWLWASATVSAFRLSLENSLASLMKPNAFELKKFDNLCPLSLNIFTFSSLPPPRKGKNCTLNCLSVTIYRHKLSKLDLQYLTFCIMLEDIISYNAYTLG